MRIWRDIPSRRGLQRMMGMINNRPNVAYIPILDAVDSYHQIRKDTMANLAPRAAALRAIARRIKTMHNGPLSTPKGSRQLAGGAGNIGDMMKALARRAEAKADYIDVLQQYYTNHPDEVADPAALIRKMQQAQSKADAGKALGVVPGVRMEAWDPVHRSWEMHFLEDGNIDTAGKIHQAYAKQWYIAVRAGTCTEPLLVFLEGTEHCTDRDTAQQTHTVTYLNVQTGNARVYQLRVQDDGTVEQAMMDPSTPLQWQPFDTQWVTKQFSDKGGFTHTLAYNWTRTKELYADLHNPNSGRDYDTFHHSSFTSGDFIRCAGMIGGKDGKIIYIDNDSGHYRPTTEYLHRLVKHLFKRGAFAPGARVRDLSLRGAPASEEEGIPAEIYANNPRGAATPWARGVVPGRGGIVMGTHRNG